MPIFGSFAASGLASKLLGKLVEPVVQFFRGNGGSSGVYGSADMTTWASIPEASAHLLHNAQWAYGNGILIVVGTAGPFNGKYSYSADGGFTWEYLYTPWYGTTYSVSFIDGYFFMPSDQIDAYGDFLIYKSADGVNWTGVSATVTNGNLIYSTLVKIGGKIVYPIPGSTSVIFSTNNGASWTLSAGGAVPSDAYDWGGVYTSSIALIYSGATTLYYSTNGTTWTASNAPSGAIRNVAYGNGKFIGAGYYSSLYESTDGMSWTAITAPATLGGECSFINGKFYISGYFTSTIYSSIDGSSWTTISAAGDGKIISTTS